MSIRDNIKSASGKRKFDNSYTCPVLGPISLQSLTEGEWQEGVLLWFIDSTTWTRIPERRKYDNVKLIQMALRDEDGNRAFSDSFEDLDYLLGLGRDITGPIYDLAYKLSSAVSPKN